MFPEGQRVLVPGEAPLPVAVVNALLAPHGYRLEETRRRGAQQVTLQRIVSEPSPERR